jgi:hypothetical protein
VGLLLIFHLSILSTKTADTSIHRLTPVVLRRYGIKTVPSGKKISPRTESRAAAADGTQHPHDKSTGKSIEKENTAGQAVSENILTFSATAF